MAIQTIPTLRVPMLRLSLGCDLTEVRPGVGAVCSFLRDRGLSDEEARACELALVEACNNAIKYVSEPGRSRPIQVDAMSHEDLIELRVHDNTPGFEWPAEVMLPDFEKETGRGLYLINALMDRVSYLRGGGENCLIMKKLFKKPSPPAQVPCASKEDLNRRLVESEQVIRDMAEELSFCYESLSAIFRCSAELGRTNNLADFARRLLSDLAQISSADWFVLRLVNKDETQLTVFTSSDPALTLPPLNLASREGMGRFVEAEAAGTREDVWFDHLNPLKPGDPLSAFKSGSVGLVHPIFMGDALFGTLTVGKFSSGALFTAVQANVVHTFTDFLAIQIANARFSEEQVRNRLVSRELEIAKTIQRSLLPKTIPKLPGYGLAGFCQSARQVGGDFYDVLKINDDSLLLVIADVMGKGLPAAMFAAILRSLLRAVPEWMNQPAALLGRVNRLLFEELSGVDMFITAQLVFVDTKARRITTASAGHCPALLTLDSEGSVKSISPEGLPLGILPDTIFSSHTETLSKNCRMLLYTDGLTEARNAEGEFFGQERLVKWLKRSAAGKRSAEELKQDLASELGGFQASTALSDDQTFLIMAE